MINIGLIQKAMGPLSQGELARRMGIHRSTVCSLLHGRFEPSVPLLRRLAKELDLDVRQLFEVDGGDGLRHLLPGTKVDLVVDSEWRHCQIGPDYQVWLIGGDCVGHLLDINSQWRLTNGN